MSVKAVACPCCWKTLFKIVRERQAGEARLQGPEIQTDAKGTFMKCPHCESRVAVTAAESGDVSIAVAPNQHAGSGYLPFVE
jgi:DNA-directed RNA polymerase subunit RPC12/RpoP